MNYFDYVKSLDMDRTLKIYQAVYSLTGYAMSIYKGYYADALDKAFFHVLMNYDEESGGDLTHYATKVVSTILLGRYNHEITHELTLNVEMDKKSATIQKDNPLNILAEKEELISSSDMKRCIKFLLPNFIKDSHLFVTKRQEDRKCSYEGLFSKFSPEVIWHSLNYLVTNYGDDMERLLELKKKCKYRNFSEDRYKSSMDETIEYVCTLRNTILYKSLTKRTLRLLYKLDLKATLDYMIERFYNGSCREAKTVVEGIDVYCTLSGQIVSGMKELRDTLENEIVGTVLSRLSVLMVVVYSRGDYMILSSSREMYSTLPIEFLDDVINLEFKEVPSKRVK